MQYTKKLNGAWIKGSEVQDGARIKLLNEVQKVESQFKDDEGNVKMQDVAKVKIEGTEGEFNIALNRATIYGLIDAYGTESKNWVGKTLTAKTEKANVAGKRVTVLYLVPEGFVVGEDEGGYVVIKKEDDGLDPDKQGF